MTVYLCKVVLVLFIYILLSGDFFNIDFSLLKNVSWWKWTGGALGAIYVTAVIIAAPKIGAANLIGMVITGQMLLAVLLDHFGLISFPVHPVNLLRVFGTILVIAGVFLVQKF